METGTAGIDVTEVGNGETSALGTTTGPGSLTTLRSGRVFGGPTTTVMAAKHNIKAAPISAALHNLERPAPFKVDELRTDANLVSFRMGCLLLSASPGSLTRSSSGFLWVMLLKPFTVQRVSELVISGLMSVAIA